MEPVVMIRAGAMFSVSPFDAMVPLLSVTCTPNDCVPGVLGVPAIAPPEEIDSPPGSEPELIEKEYGGTPPVAATPAPYPVPTVPGGNCVVVIDRGEGAVVILALGVLFNENRAGAMTPGTVAVALKI